MSAPPLTPDEMARLRDQFGMGGQPPPAAPIGPPPPPQGPTPAPAPPPPPPGGLSLPQGIGGAPSGPPRIDAPIDTSPDVPFAPRKPEEKRVDLTPIARAMGREPSAQPAQAYPPARYVTGKWEGRSRVIEGAQPVSNEAKLQQGLGLTQQGDAAEMAAQGEAQAAAREQAQYDLVGDHLERQAAEANARRAAQDAEYQRAQSDYRDAVQTAAKIGDVNPNRFWQERGVGPQIMATIGMALGAAGAALTGGSNGAAQIVESAIDRDLQAQRDNIAKAQGNVSAARGVLGEMRERFGDSRQADIAAKDAAFGVAESRIKALLADAKSDDAKARGMAMLGQIQEKRGQLTQQWDALAQGKIRTAESYVPGHMVGGAPAGGPTPEAADDKRNVVAPDGTVFQMPSAAEGAQMRSRVSAAQSIKHIAERIDELRSKPSTYLTGENKAEAETLSKEFVFELQKLHGLKRLSDADLHFAQEMTGDPTSLFSRSGQRLKLIADNAMKTIDDDLKSAGSRVVSRGYGTDQAGRVVATQNLTGREAVSANVPAGFRPAGGGPAPAPFRGPPVKQYDTSRPVVTPSKGGGKRAAARVAGDDDYVSPADEAEGDE